MTESAPPGEGQAPVASQPAMAVIRAGLVDYQRAWAWQSEIHAKRVANRIPDTTLLLQHDSVYTAGRRTTSIERPVDGTPVIDVDRGGKITWHGPGQLVGYPIIELADPIDVVAYVRRLEMMIMDVCAEFGVATAQVAGRSGVWCRGSAGQPDRKIAAIGVRVAQRVTLHGFALNCNPNLRAFDAIVPCGITDADVTSLSRELGQVVTVDDVLPAIERALPLLSGAVASVPAESLVRSSS